MYFVSFYMNCGQRPCRAKVFACSASDAPFLIHYRNPERLRVVRILPYHADGSGRTVSCAIAAADFVCVHDAVVKAYDSVSYLDRRLLLNAYRPDRTCRTYVRTFRTFRTAVASFV